MENAPNEKVITICQIIGKRTLIIEFNVLESTESSGKPKSPKRYITPCKAFGNEILLQQMDPFKGKLSLIKKYIKLLFFLDIQVFQR